MIIKHLTETLCTGLEPLDLALRNCRGNGVELLAIAIGTLVVQLTRSPGPCGRQPRMCWLSPLLVVLRRPGWLQATTFVRTAGRMLGPALFS